VSPLLELIDIGKTYGAGGLFGGGAQRRAVDGVSLQLHKGETLGVVGESGSGKSTLGKMIVRLEQPSEGQIKLAGRDIAMIKDRKAQLDYARRVQMVFQDPYSSLNPFMTVAAALARPLRLHGGLSGHALAARVDHLLQAVGLSPPTKYLERYPHELSGGERQRVAIARALSVEPDLIVADEPVASLDVSVRAQILRLMRSIQDQLGIAYFFVTHDLAILPAVSHRVAVIYSGRIVEIGRTTDIIKSPRHPYTAALLSAIPVADPQMARRHRQRRPASSTLKVAAGTGCAFSSRCAWAVDQCRAQRPPLITQEGRQVACFEERQEHIARSIV
jgi:oligopeptide/dipeptide ABC transporter ATP-binding protein